MFCGGLLLRQKCWQGDLAFVITMMETIDDKITIIHDIEGGLLKACEGGHANVVGYLLTLNDLKFDFKTLFLISCKQNNKELCSLLIWYIPFEDAHDLAVSVNNIIISNWIEQTFLSKFELETKKVDESINVDQHWCSFENPWYKDYVKTGLNYSQIEQQLKTFNHAQRQDIFKWACAQKQVKIIRLILDFDSCVIRCGKEVSELFNDQATIAIGYDILNKNPPSETLSWVFSQACKNGDMKLVSKLKTTQTKIFNGFMDAVKNDQRAVANVLWQDALKEALRNKRQFKTHWYANDLEEAIIALRERNWDILANFFSAALDDFTEIALTEQVEI